MDKEIMNTNAMYEELLYNFRRTYLKIKQKINKRCKLKKVDLILE